MKQEIIEIVKRFEGEEITAEVAIDQIRELSGKIVDEYSLRNYWRSQDLEDFASVIAMQSIEDWERIDDGRALELIREMRENVCDDAILQRNGEALAKKYRKADVVGIVFSDSFTEKQVLAELKKDTAIHL